MATIDEVIARIQEMNSPAVGLTDHGTVAGHLEFGRKCVEAGIKPVFGIEAYQARVHRKEPQKQMEKNNRRSHYDSLHLILLAKNNTGLRNLWTLSSLAYTEGMAHNKPRVDLELLEKYREGIIATSACLSSKTVWDLEHNGKYDSAKDLAEIFKDDWYIEIHTYDTDHQRNMNRELVDMARSQGWPLVYATDAHYSCESEAKYHDVFNTMTQRTTMDNEDRINHPPCLWIQDEKHIRQTFSPYLEKSAVNEMISNSLLIADKCNVDLPGARNRIPVFFPNKEPNYGPLFLIDRIEEGLERIGKSDDPQYLARIEKEVEIILEANLVNFFLIEYDVLAWTRSQGITLGPGRGSVGGSLVAYCLGITDIDPIRHDLIFERFYNKGREKGGMPDIDSDIPTDKRDAVKAYLGERYGEDHVAQLGTTMRLAGKSSINKVGNALQIPQADLTAIGKIIDSTTDSGIMADWEDIIETEALQPWVNQYPELFDYAGKFHGRIFTYGIHASGFLISDRPMQEVAPLKMLRGDISTQFDMHDAESLGFMKIDLLGLRNLDILTEARKIINERRGIDWDFTTLHHKTTEEINNAPIWHLLDKGLTTGLFQVEDGREAKSIAKDMKCRSLEDLSLLVAINRPGPDSIEYLDRRNGGVFESVHPFLDGILKDTQGVFIYQEQIIEFMQALGFDLEEADEVRSIMGKKKVEKMAEFYPRYLENATKYMDEKTADEIWDSIVTFSRYGFNKSHALGYGAILLWCLWTKALYPAEFLLGAMRSNPKQIQRYVAEAVRMGIQVLPPDINESNLTADLMDDETIRMGLTDVKGVGDISWVVENRPFTNYENLLEKIDKENDEFLAAKKEGTAEGPSPKQRFSATKHKALYNAGAFDSLEERDWLSSNEIRTYQKDLLGVVLDNRGAKTLEKYAEDIEETCVPYSEILEVGEDYCIAGVVTEVEHTKTRTGNDMEWVSLEFEGENLRLALFGDTIRRYAKKVEEGAAIIAQVRKTERGINFREVMRLK